MQTATLDLLDVDPFDLVEDEEPFAATAKVDAAASVAELLERALKVIAGFEETSRRPARRPRRARKARVTAHLPGQHRQQDHAGGSSVNALKGPGVLDAEAYASSYGELQDESGIELGADGETRNLTARLFGNGDMHVVLDLEDGKSQVFEEMNPESMRQLAYDIEEVLAVDETEFELDDPYDVVADADSDKHGFYVAKDGVGDIRIRPPDTDEDDYLEIGSEQAQEFANALLDMADAYEEHSADAGEVVAARPHASRRKAVIAHGNHDQSTHGRKKGLSAPKAGVPTSAPKKAAPKAAPAAGVKPPVKKAAPRKGQPNTGAPKAPAGKTAKPARTPAVSRVVFSESVKAPVTAHLKGQHNQDSHGNDHAAPDLGKLDRLKLGNRIPLSEGEKLRSSRKFKSSENSSWDLLAAEVDTPNGREIRLGVVDPGHRRHWTAGSTEKLYERIDEIDTLLEDMDAGERFDALHDEREALAGQVGEGSSHSKTVTLDPAAVARLRTEIGEAEEAAAEWAHNWDVLWENDPSGEGSGRPDPKLVNGSIPLSGGDVLEWQVVGDGESDPATWRVEIGIRDLLADDDWYIGRNDDAAVFLEGDTEAFLDGLAELADSQVKAAASAARRHAVNRAAAGHRPS